MNFLMVFDFTQFWLDGRPGNEYFWISHKISGLLTPLTPLGVHPQLFKTTVWNRYEWFLLLWYCYCRNLKNRWWCSFYMYLLACIAMCVFSFLRTQGKNSRSWIIFSCIHPMPSYKIILSVNSIAKISWLKIWICISYKISFWG